MGSQGGRERRIKNFCENLKKQTFFFFLGGGGVRLGGGSSWGGGGVGLVGWVG